MDVEKTVQFLLEHQAAFASRMDEMAAAMTDLRSVVHEMAVNQVALSKTQVRFAADMKDLQGAMGELQDIMRGLQERQKRTDETVDRLGIRVDRLVQALENRFGTNGSAA